MLISSDDTDEPSYVEASMCPKTAAQMTVNQSRTEEHEDLHRASPRAVLEAGVMKNRAVLDTAARAGVERPRLESSVRAGEAESGHP